MKTLTQLHVSSHGSEWNRYDLNNIIGTRPHAHPTHKSPLVVKILLPTHCWGRESPLNHFPSSIIEGFRTLEGWLFLENQWQIIFFDIYELHVWVEDATLIQKTLKDDYWEIHFTMSDRRTCSKSISKIHDNTLSNGLSRFSEQRSIPSYRDPI